MKLTPMTFMKLTPMRDPYETPTPMMMNPTPI